MTSPIGRRFQIGILHSRVTLVHLNLLQVLPRVCDRYTIPAPIAEAGGAAANSGKTVNRVYTSWEGFR